MDINLRDLMAKNGMAIGSESYKPSVTKSTKFGNENFIRLGNLCRRTIVRHGAENANCQIDITRIAARGEGAGAVLDKIKDFGKKVWEKIVEICKTIVSKIQGVIDSIFDNETKLRKGIDGIPKVLAQSKKDIEADKIKDKKFKLNVFEGGTDPFSPLKDAIKTMEEQTKEEAVILAKANSINTIEELLNDSIPGWKDSSFRESDVKETLEKKKDKKKKAKETLKNFKDGFKVKELSWEEANNKAKEYLESYQGLAEVIGEKSVTKGLSETIKNLKNLEKTATAIVKAGKISIKGDDDAMSLANKAGNYIHIILTNGIMSSVIDLGTLKAIFGSLHSHLKQCAGTYLATNFNVK